MLDSTQRPASDETPARREDPAFELQFPPSEPDGGSRLVGARGDDAELKRIGEDIARGISWMHWVIGISLINAITAAAGVDWSFALALATVLLPPIVMHQVGIEMQISWLGAIGVVIALVPIGALFVLTRLAKGGRSWALALAMVLYAGDAAIFAALGDWLSVILHAVCLFFAFRAWRALQDLASRSTTPLTR